MGFRLRLRLWLRMMLGFSAASVIEFPMSSLRAVHNLVTGQHQFQINCKENG